MVTEKPVVWLGSSLDDMRAFADEPRRAAGYQLYRIQRGLLPDDWKPMSSVGGGVIEIRIHLGGAFRVFYVARYQEAVYVLHAFEKKSQKSWRAGLETARRRFAALLEYRRRFEGSR
jgi:phage-related protein